MVTNQLADMTELKPTNFHLSYNRDLVERAKLLRKTMTPAEKKLWNDELKHWDIRVLRQRPIDHFIVDFYCAKLKLVIEVDGDSHFTEAGKLYDQDRTARLECYGLQVIRFTNQQVLLEFESVCQQLKTYRQQNMNTG